MKKAYECASCGVVSESKKELCDPELQGGMADYCGTSKKSGRMCDNMKERGTYVCNTCGRTATQPELVCKPVMPV